MSIQRQIDRIREISSRLQDLAKAYEHLAYQSGEMQTSSPEFIAMVEMGGELTLDALKRQATLLEVLRVAQHRVDIEPKPITFAPKLTMARVWVGES